MKHKTLIVLGVIILLAGTGGILFKIKRNAFEEISPRKGDVVEAIYGLGTVKSNRSFEVKLGVTSTVTRLYVKEGDLVKKGDHLVDFEGMSSFFAPFDGTVTVVNVQLGETVYPQVSALKMEDLQDLTIEVSLEQESALRVKSGQKVQILFESLRGEKQEGRVDALFPKQGGFIARILVPHLGENVLPGMTADVAVEVGKINNALLIPVSAIHSGVVLLKREGKRKKIPVQIGHVDGLWAEVRGGDIQLNDLLLVKGGSH